MTLILTVINVIPLVVLEISDRILLFNWIIRSLTSETFGLSPTPDSRALISRSCCRKFMRIICKWDSFRLFFKFSRNMKLIWWIKMKLTWSDDSISSRLSLGKLASLSSEAVVNSNNLSTSEHILSCLFKLFNGKWEKIMFELIKLIWEIALWLMKQRENMQWENSKWYWNNAMKMYTSAESFKFQFDLLCADSRKKTVKFRLE